MNADLAHKLNDLPKRLLADDVRLGRIPGNEIGFFVFDYDPKYELEVRAHLSNVIAKLKTLEPGYRVASISMIEQVYGVLEDQDLLERSMELERELGSEAAIEAIQQAATAEDVAERIVRLNSPESTDLYLIHGVGAAFPLLRAHSLLSNLHSSLKGRPLVLFFPGRFTGRRLVLLDKLQDDHYYRAFRLYEKPC